MLATKEAESIYETRNNAILCTYSKATFSSSIDSTIQMCIYKTDEDFFCITHFVDYMSGFSIVGFLGGHFIRVHVPLSTQIHHSFTSKCLFIHVHVVSTVIGNSSFIYSMLCIKCLHYA